ncbi:MAG: proline--tRNA ligase [Verrucomicrobiales bacterium]|nr:proline--tRNA ligase [Verrucomicrobiales bacterium]|tara:strand:+ start:65579 stop:67282 length:1704 start_codon:yes stop_codon:yes gene_type:complete
MRWSETFIPTLKEAPAEAEILSHQLLLRAGLVRKLAGGLYTFLPLGLRVLRKIEAIVREEMNRAGALEVLMPAVQPPEIWKASGRYEQAADVLFKVRDSRNREWLLGPTHEEVITTLAAAEIDSYRQMPLNFYQIQTKFRDEIRPRFGLMRAREFIMKDAYSFDGTDEGAMLSYQKMYNAYVRIFDRVGVQAFPVEADTGVMGGKHSHEFMVPAETGESEVAYTEDGGYAANVEKADSQGPTASTPKECTGSIEKFATPGVKTIEDLTQEPFCVPAKAQIKTLVFIAEDKPVIALLRGDDEANEAKLAVALGTGVFRAANAEEIQQALGAQPGSLGAVGVNGIPVIADEQLRGAAGMTTGANEDGLHIRNVSVERDLGEIRWADLRTVREGELSACGQPLKIRRAIEVGHVFKLGTKYSEALELSFLSEDGKRGAPVMGCYGLGVTRTLQAVIEYSNDENGIIWPVSVAPFAVCVTALDVDPEGEVMKTAVKLHDELSGQGVDVLLDDREERPGAKFKDSELIGIPVRIAVGSRSLDKGEVELACRREGGREGVPVSEAVARVLECL